MKQTLKATSESIYELVREIPVGKVTTYGALAKAAGIKNPRLIGAALHRNPDQSTIPCHRVVNSQGRLAPAFAFGGFDAQRKLLEEEGVAVKNNKVDLGKYFWDLR